MQDTVTEVIIFISTSEPFTTLNRFVNRITSSDGDTWLCTFCISIPTCLIMFTIANNATIKTRIQICMQIFLK